MVDSEGGKVSQLNIPLSKSQSMLSLKYKIIHEDIYFTNYIVSYLFICLFL